jgi:two-component system sensor histidine kinase RegB
MCTPMSTLATFVETGSRNEINYHWLARLRWSAAAGQLLTIGVGAALVPGELALAPLLGIVGLGVLSQVALAKVVGSWSAERWNNQGQLLLGGVLVADMILLTTLLAVAGGPSNPFSVFLLVHIVLAAMLLGSSWAWGLNVLAILSFSMLFVFHRPVPSLAMHHGDPHSEPAPCIHCGAVSSPAAASPAEAAADTAHVDHSGHGAAQPGGDGGAVPWNLHLLGMLLAFGAASTCIVYFGTRASAALAERERLLEGTRAKQAREQQLAALGAVAAGAAHELATPLGTIAIAAAELDRALRGDNLEVDELRDDTRLILLEVARCRSILDQMALKTGSEVGEQSVSMRTSQLIPLALDGLAEAARVRIAQRDDPELLVPPNAVARALRVLLSNALQAEPGTPVEVEVVHAGTRVTLRIQDSGPTLSDDALRRIGEPFHTTREPGQGMGLGVYLARTLFETLGGTLTYSARPSRGTCAEITMPSKPT